MYNSADNSNNANDSNAPDDDQQKMHENVFDDGSIELEISNSITGDIINYYTKFFKEKQNKHKNLTFFDGIDTSDPISTNMIMEELFNEMAKYKDGDDEYIKVVQYKDLTKDMTLGDELYCIMRNDEPFFVSQCLFSILLEFREMVHAVGNKYSLKIADLK